ncbi:MAG: class I SAM-dependent methyltransferase [Myxococcales bacterium]|nr:class I SAM-dependent methyltransferase [Myxococcales bacterium]
MNQTTAHALNAINLAFYRERADEFSASREYAWPGWKRLLPHLDAARMPDGPLRVLDLGCGNGRFAAFLAEQLGDAGASLRYCGVDASDPLLARARARALPGERCAWHALDFVQSPGRLPDGPFEFIALLGVLHGVPGQGQRRALLREAAARLAPGGRLALTCWRFAELDRFRKRLVSWETYNRRALQPIDPGQLEPGDHLMPWGRGKQWLRYCHATGADEREALVRGLALRCVESFLADGRSADLNHYAVYEAARAPRLR